MPEIAIQTGQQQTRTPFDRGPIPVLITVRELDQGGVERDVTKIAMHLDRSRFQPHVEPSTPRDCATKSFAPPACRSSIFLCDLYSPSTHYVWQTQCVTT